jgi:hypothetical protein
VIYYFFNPVIGKIAGEETNAKDLAAMLSFWGTPLVLDHRGTQWQGQPTIYTEKEGLLLYDPIPRYHYVWFPNGGEFVRFNRRSDSPYLENADEVSIGHVPLHYPPVEKHLPAVMDFPSVAKTVDFITKNNMGVPPFYHGCRFLRDRPSDHHFNENGTTVNICQDSFPWNGPDDYHYTIVEDGVMLDLLDRNGKSLNKKQICYTEREVREALRYYRQLRT